MDRTIIVPYRAEERELSVLLYKSINGLTLVHPPTEELRKCLSEEMFIKQNQQAFFQVMHYLFRILDPQEFRKRFYWPITDKRSEANFRSSTVDYLKYINEKHQLNWTNIKSYLVVMPGGMKFISFLLDFVNFIAQELVKQKEKQLNVDAHKYRDQISESYLHKIGAKDAIFKEMTSEFLSTIENIYAKYNEKSLKVMKQMELLSQETGISVDMLIDDKFLDDFEASNMKLFEQHYSDRTQKVLQMDSTVKELKEAMDRFYSKETGYKYDKQRLCLQLQRIRDNFSIEELKNDSIGSKVTDEGVNINTLILTCNAINATIQNELKSVNDRPCAGEFVYARLLSLKKGLQEIEAQLTEFRKILNTNAKADIAEYPQTPVQAKLSNPTRRNLHNNLLMKLISTPPIRLQAPEGGGKPRLALGDSKTTNTNETFNNFLAPPLSNTIRLANRHNSLADQSMSDLNSSINRSKMVDPIQLLRSTSKKAPSQAANVSNLSGNLKLRQALLFNEDDDDKPTSSSYTLTTPKTQSKMISKNISKTLTKSSFTPFGSNDCTRIARSQFHLDSCTGSGNNIFNNSTSLNYSKKASAVKKVQDASVNITNLSTSPSGRLEPLVTAEDFDVPKITLNNLSLLEQNNSMALEIPKFNLNCDAPVVGLELNDENNPNGNNIGNPNQNDVNTNKYELEQEEALFNISDSILKDVTL